MERRKILLSEGIEQLSFLLICTVIYKNIRTLNFNEIHFIRKFY